MYVASRAHLSKAARAGLQFNAEVELGFMFHNYARSLPIGDNMKPTSAEELSEKVSDHIIKYAATAEMAIA